MTRFALTQKLDGAFLQDVQLDGVPRAGDVVVVTRNFKERRLLVSHVVWHESGHGTPELVVDRMCSQWSQHTKKVP